MKSSGKLVSKSLEIVDNVNDYISSAPENRDIRYHYASGLAMSEDKEQAIKELQIVLADETDFQTRDDAEVLRAKLQQ